MLKQRKNLQDFSKKFISMSLSQDKCVLAQKWFSSFLQLDFDLDLLIQIFQQFLYNRPRKSLFFSRQNKSNRKKIIRKNYGKKFSKIFENLFGWFEERTIFFS